MMMRAMVLRGPLPQHGFSDIEEVEIPVPEPGWGEVRVRIAVAGASDGEHQILGNTWTGIFLRRRTFPLTLGWDFSGTVDKIGPGVTEEDTRYSGLDVGAACFGFLQPPDVSEPVAAAAATCGITALQGLRDKGGLTQHDSGAANKRVLIIGAAGGIGAVAVGIAKRLGAGHVTGICSTKDVERVRALGADQVLDRSQTNPLVLAEGDLPYDIVFDTPAVHSYAECQGLLKRGGTYVTTQPSPWVFTGALRAALAGHHCTFFGVKATRIDLELLGSWLSDGLPIPLDKEYDLTEVADALARFKARDRAGRVILRVARAADQDANDG